jgi:hypothetical protein
MTNELEKWYKHLFSSEKGYLVLSHYNFPKLEKRHYYSSILKFATTILLLPDSCHFLRLPTFGSHCQNAFVHTCFVSFPLHSLTCGPHMSASSSTSSHLGVVRGLVSRCVHGGGAGVRQPLPETCRRRSGRLVASFGARRPHPRPSLLPAAAAASIARVKIRSNPGWFGCMLVRLAASSPFPCSTRLW